ncbi:hypothetical protein ABZX60_09700 [Streptomyces olivaceus]|uniref:hypothetical protein n=1 Tax=Streptomyces olivaceus TaxID=47716 RepID=UPI0033AD9DD1
MSANFHERPVPEELTDLVRYHSYRIAKYLYFAVDEGHCRGDLAKWQRNTLSVSSSMRVICAPGRLPCPTQAENFRRATVSLSRQPCSVGRSSATRVRR